MSEGFTFDASYGGIRIDVQRTRIRHGRKQIAHRQPKRDGATLEDSGREELVCDLEFIFIDRAQQAGETEAPKSYLERFRAFDALVATDAIRRLVHPYMGALRCGVGNFEHSADGESQPAIYCSATFTEETSFTPVIDARPGVQTLAGSHEVASKVLQANAALSAPGTGLTGDELEASTAELAGTRAVVENWVNDPNISVREVQLQMASINSALNRRLEQLDAANNIDRHPIMKQYTLLQHQVRQAAAAYSSNTSRIVTITTVKPMPLRLIASRFYGARESAKRFDELLELNPGINNPALVGAGVEIKAYSANAEPGDY